MFKKFISIMRLCSLKIRFRKRFEIKKIKQLVRYDTEICIGKRANLCLGSIITQTNVRLVCVAGELSIGNNVSFNKNTNVICRQKILIGDNCLFGPNVCIYDHDHVFNIDGIKHNEYKCDDIIIESGCWIGAGVIILRGTYIGRNTIIGAGTIVKGNIPPNTLITSTREINITPLV